MNGRSIELHVIWTILTPNLLIHKKSSIKRNLGETKSNSLLGKKNKDFFQRISKCTQTECIPSWNLRPNEYFLQNQLYLWNGLKRRDKQQ